MKKNKVNDFNFIKKKVKRVLKGKSKGILFCNHIFFFSMTYLFMWVVYV